MMSNNTEPRPEQSDSTKEPTSAKRNVVTAADAQMDAEQSEDELSSDTDVSPEDAHPAAPAVLRERVRKQLAFMYQPRNEEGWKVLPLYESYFQRCSREENGLFRRKDLMGELLTRMQWYERMGKKYPKTLVSASERIQLYDSAESCLKAIIECRKDFLEEKSSRSSFTEWHISLIRHWKNWIRGVGFVKQNTRGILAESNDRKIDTLLASLEGYLAKIDGTAEREHKIHAKSISDAVDAMKTYLDAYGRKKNATGRNLDNAKTQHRCLQMQRKLVKAILDAADWLKAQPPRPDLEIPSEMLDKAALRGKCIKWFKRNSLEDYTDES